MSLANATARRIGAGSAIRSSCDVGAEVFASPFQQPMSFAASSSRSRRTSAIGLLEVLRDVLLVDGQDQHLVVGEQVRARRPRRSRAGATPGRRWPRRPSTASTASASSALRLTSSPNTRGVAVMYSRLARAEVVVVVDLHEVRLVASARVTPVVRCASSQTTRSKSASPCRWASAITSIDW